MKPIGPLMREHRLIERMISILQEKLFELESGKDIDLSFIETAVDFATHVCLSYENYISEEFAKSV